MKYLTFYDEKTGVLSGRSLLVSDERLIQANTPPGHKPIEHPKERRLDHLCERIDVVSGRVMPFQPPSPGSDHEWDEKTRRWAMTETARKREEARRSALAEIRRIERELQPRALRELLLELLGDKTSTARLKAIDARIAALRARLTDPAG